MTLDFQQLVAAEHRWLDEQERMRMDQEHILQFFSYLHLPNHLQKIALEFASLANRIVETLPRNPERTVALRKLLEAKDAAVRAAVAK